MNNKVMRRSYLLARGYVFLCGVILILSTYVSQVVMPELYYDNGPVPTWHDRSFDILATLGYALLLLFPYRWSVRGWAFRVRLALLIMVSLLLSYVVITGMYGFMQGQKHWLIVPASGLILGLAILAPSALIVKRRLINA
jgi:hypothetical protein